MTARRRLGGAAVVVGVADEGRGMGPDGHGRTVAGLIAAQARMRPAAPAVIYGARVWSFAELDRLGRRVATGLAELGIGPGDRVALWLPNAPAWLILYFACARLGAVAVAVNTRFRSAELGDIVGRSGAKALAMWPGFRGIDFPRLLGEADPRALETLATVIVYDEAGEGAGEATVPLPGRRVVSYRTLELRPPVRFDRSAPAAGSVIFTTSGTTHAPKFVLHHHHGVAEHARMVAADFGYDAPDAVMLLALPLCGVFGFSQAMASLASGRPMVMMQTFEAGPAADLVRRRRVTHMNGSDEMYQAMLEARTEDRPFPSLRLAGFASFNRDPADFAAAACCRGVPVVGLYGMSELQALFARQDRDRDFAARILPGGRPVAAEARVRVRDPDTGRLLDHGQSGELEIGGPSRMAGYFDDDAATAAAITEDGFVRTGDLGHSLADGRFVFAARMGDVLRLGGYLVSPAEIESHIEQHPAVTACQVVGATDAGRPSSVAFVIPAAGAGFDEDGLRAFCTRGLAKFKVPARIQALDSFPMTQSPNGLKVQRARLREMAAALVSGGS